MFVVLAIRTCLVVVLCQAALSTPTPLPPFPLVLHNVSTGGSRGQGGHHDDRWDGGSHRAEGRTAGRGTDAERKRAAAVDGLWL